MKPGELSQSWLACCAECKGQKILDGPVTRPGARHMLENLQWADGPHGWICPSCRTVNVPGASRHRA